MDERLQFCKESPGGRCAYPLAWSVSPHLLYLAPDWLRWCVQQQSDTSDPAAIHHRSTLTHIG